MKVTGEVEKKTGLLPTGRPANGYDGLKNPVWQAQFTFGGVKVDTAAVILPQSVIPHPSIMTYVLPALQAGLECNRRDLGDCTSYSS
jgi:hypothetical protein